MKIARGISKYYKCLKNKLLWKIYEKEASELKFYRAGFSRVSFVYLFAKEFKTVLLGSLPAEHLKECASCRDQSGPKQGEQRSEKMSLKGFVLSPGCSSVHNPPDSQGGQLRPREEVVRCYNFRLSY